MKIHGARLHDDGTVEIDVEVGEGHRSERYMPRLPLAVAEKFVQAQPTETAEGAGTVWIDATVGGFQYVVLLPRSLAAAAKEAFSQVLQTSTT